MYTYALLVSIYIVVRLYFKFTTNWNKSYTCLVGKTTIVTGANSGIGYYTALDFAKRGARVILACRSEERAIRAKEKIIAATGNANVDYRLVDFTSLKSVREFCKGINESEEKIDILVNNAGAAGLGNSFTKDGLQILWQVNHLSEFLLTHLLIDKLKKSTSSRVVMVSSVIARSIRFKLNQVNTFGDLLHDIYDAKTYGFTKVSNILFAREFAKRIPSGVNIYALHPGIVTTEIWNNFKGFKAKIQAFFKSFIYMKSSEEGAQTTIYCAVSKDLDNKTGKLYANCKEIPMYSTCLDMDFAEKLWEKCEELVGLEEHEKIKKNQ